MNCIICNSSLSQVNSEISYFHLDVAYCKNCDLHITGRSEEIQLKAIKEFYQKGEYWDSQQTPPEHVIDSNYTDAYSIGKRKQWLSQFSYCKPYLQNKKKLLEIGSGLGQTIFWFEQIGLSVTGIEPDKRNVELINKKLLHGKCLEGYIEEINIDDEFDIVWISHVLEHLVRPDRLLAKLKKNLGSGGILFIEVPNCENKDILNASVRLQPHLYHFSQTALRNLARKTGYSVESSGFFRAPTISEGIKNMIFRKYLKIKNPYPYYPRITTDNKNGLDIRMILKNNL